MLAIAGSSTLLAGRYVIIAQLMRSIPRKSETSSICSLSHPKNHSRISEAHSFPQYNCLFDVLYPLHDATLLRWSHSTYQSYQIPSFCKPPTRLQGSTHTPNPHITTHRSRDSFTPSFFATPTSIFAESEIDMSVDLERRVARCAPDEQRFLIYDCATG